MTTAPDRAEAPEYYFTYIDQVTGGDICRFLQDDLGKTLTLLQGISEAQSLHRYAPGKWSIKEVVGHINDTERLFVFRAFWFARGFDSPLPSFDEKVSAAAANTDERPWESLVKEFRALREATIAFFQSLPAAAWQRQGIASGNPFTVRALAFVAGGHAAHHTRILRERYLQPPG